MSSQSAFLVRESHETYALNGPSTSFKPLDKFPKIPEEAKFAVTSPDGKLLAVGYPDTVNIHKTSDGSLYTTLRHRMLSAKFSNHGQFLQSWDNPGKNNDNFNIWSIIPSDNDGNSKKPGTIIHSQKLSKQPESYFSGDETIYARLAESAVLFYDTTNFGKLVRKTAEDNKIANFSMSPASSGGIHIAVFIQGSKTSGGGPSIVKMFKYPNLETSSVVSSKSFFQADRVDMKWNNKGSGVLVTTMTDVDKTGGSYYGKTMLHYLDINQSSATVQTDESNVIHASKWSPNSKEFCVISGKMPNTNAALFNLKCEKIYDFGITARNDIYFNPQGNMLLLCGFGNLPGSIEIWKIVRNEEKKIAAYRCSNVTQLEWLNDGYHFITATTAPRMQVDNGYKVWDCTGKMIHEWKAAKHLFGVVPFTTPGHYPEFPTEKLENYIKQLDDKKSTVKVEEKKVGAYVPAHKRKGNAGKPILAKSADGDNQLSEKDKKIRNLKKKLTDIEKIKGLQSKGEKLEKNQLEKLGKETELLEEIQALELS